MLIFLEEENTCEVDLEKLNYRDYEMRVSRSAKCILTNVQRSIADYHNTTQSAGRFHLKELIIFNPTTQKIDT